MGYWRRSRLKVLIATVGISLAGLAIVATVYGTVAKNTRLAVIELEPANSEIDFDLDGFPHQVHGKFKIVSGKVEVDPSSGELSGLVVVDTASGDSGNGLRDAEMRNSILEAQRYPQITFTPSHCQQAVAMLDRFRGPVRGTLALHGIKQEIEIDTEVLLQGDEVKVSGHFVVPYVDWGLKDPSLLFLHVAKQVAINVHTQGHLIWMQADEQNQRLSGGGSP